MLKQKDLEKFAKIWALRASPAHEEAKAAERAILEFLHKRGLTLADLPALEAQLKAAGLAPSDKPDDDDFGQDTADALSEGVTPLDLVRHILPQFVDLKPDYYYDAAALWIVATHVYDHFGVSPRLALLSPVRRCGKTSFLDVIARLIARGHKTDSVTGAAVYHAVDEQRYSLCVDEADNLGLRENGPLRALLNSGHRRGGGRTIVSNGRARRFALLHRWRSSAIGSLPLPLLDRSIVLHMQRRPLGAPRLRKFKSDDADLATIERELKRWAASHPVLATDPPLPAKLGDRAADNWQPLISVADHFGSYWGERVQKAAVAFSREHVDEDLAVLLLADIPTVFDELETDFIFSRHLVDRLRALDGRGDWSALTAIKIAALLEPFEIRPKPIWPPRRTPSSKGARGYLRS